MSLSSYFIRRPRRITPAIFFTLFLSFPTLFIGFYLSSKIFFLYHKLQQPISSLLRRRFMRAHLRRQLQEAPRYHLLLRYHKITSLTILFYSLTLVIPAPSHDVLVRTQLRCLRLLICQYSKVKAPCKAIKAFLHTHLVLLAFRHFSPPTFLPPSITLPRLGGFPYLINQVVYLFPHSLSPASASSATTPSLPSSCIYPLSTSSALLSPNSMSPQPPSVPRNLYQSPWLPFPHHHETVPSFIPGFWH